MNCPECNAEIPRGWVRCAECGHTLQNVEWQVMMGPQRNIELKGRSVYSTTDFMIGFVVLLFAFSSIVFTFVKHNSGADLAKNKIEVAFQVETQMNEGQVQIFGTTNLPDDTELVVVLTNMYYYGESKVAVKNGNFSSKLFSISGKPLGAGEYTVEVSMNSALMQDEKIQKQIGKHGEMLTGPYVSKTTGSLIKYATNLEIN
ncbi:MAG: zinc ribbon domain-containing protein [Pelosinus sp.]|nr:zinc ribbon domain-containing protein [Pelosinus sp.]